MYTCTCIVKYEISFVSVQELTKQKEDLLREREDQLDQITDVSNALHLLKDMIVLSSQSSVEEVPRGI